jgi:hypothetical protein
MAAAWAEREREREREKERKRERKRERERGIPERFHLLDWAVKRRK